ncbi:hypothetical protein JCM10213v2_003255 [Rhodosporidiobolus nylandii]
MLDRLPAEATLAILELILPADITLANYRARQDFFRRLCLVSRRYRSIALPLLEQAARISGLKALIALRGSMDALGGAQKSLRAGEGPPLLEDVRLVGLDNTFDLSCLNKLKNLRRLVLHKVAWRADFVLRLPKLEELTFHPDRSASNPPPAVLLMHSNLPSLRAAYVGQITDDWTYPRNGVLAFPASDPYALDLVATYSEKAPFLVCWSSQDGRVSRSSFMDDERVARLTARQAKYLRVVGPEGKLYHGKEGVWLDLSRVLRGSKTEVLYLPPSLRARASDGWYQQKVWRELEEECEKRGILIRRAEEGVEADVLVPKHFIQHGAKVRRKIRAEAKARIAEEAGEVKAETA